MKKTDFPLKKTFEQDFISEGGQTLFTLKYDQATLEEYHEFFSLSQEERMEVLYDIIRSQVKRNWREKIRDFFGIKKSYLMEKAIDVPLIIKNIIANRFRMYKSIYEGKTSTTGKGKPKIGLYSANLSVVCQKYCIPPHDLYRLYTLEQYLWLLDGVIYQSNEMTKEGQAENRVAMLDKEAIRLRTEATKAAFRNKGFDKL